MLWHNRTVHEEAGFLQYLVVVLGHQLRFAISSGAVLFSYKLQWNGYGRSRGLFCLNLRPHEHYAGHMVVSGTSAR